MSLYSVSSFSLHEVMDGMKTALRFGSLGIALAVFMNVGLYAQELTKEAKKAIRKEKKQISNAQFSRFSGITSQSDKDCIFVVRYTYLPL